MKQCLLALTICLASQSILAAGAAPGESLEDYVARQLIVLFKDENQGGYSAKLIAATASNPSINAPNHARLGNPSAGRRLLEGITSQAMQDNLAKYPDNPRARLERYVVLTYPNSASAAATKKRFENDYMVLSVEQNIIVPFSATPTDRYFSQDPSNPAPGNYQWGMQALNMPAAWGKIRGTAWIAAIDAGIEKTHPDLQQNLRPQLSRNFLSGGDPVDYQESATMGHGTHVAGIMSATPQYEAFDNHNANTGVTGVCWTCSYAALRAAGTRPSEDAIVSALTFAADHGVESVNMSFGNPNASS